MANSNQTEIDIQMCLLYLGGGVLGKVRGTESNNGSIKPMEASCGK